MALTKFSEITEQNARLGWFSKEKLHILSKITKISLIAFTEAKKCCFLLPSSSSCQTHVLGWETARTPYTMMIITSCYRFGFVLPKTLSSDMLYLLYMHFLEGDLESGVLWFWTHWLKDYNFCAELSQLAQVKMSIFSVCLGSWHLLKIASSGTKLPTNFE